MGLAEAVLTAALDAGQIPRRPIRPLAQVLLGALDEAVIYVARAPDPDAARAEVRRLVDGLRG